MAYADYIAISGDVMGRGLILALPFILLLSIVFMVMNFILSKVVK